MQEKLTIKRILEMADEYYEEHVAEPRRVLLSPKKMHELFTDIPNDSSYTAMDSASSKQVLSHGARAQVGGVLVFIDMDAYLKLGLSPEYEHTLGLIE